MTSPAAEAAHACTQELAVMVARSRNGDTRPFPVAETKHKDSILLTTEVPANVSYHILDAARQLALNVVSLLDGAWHATPGVCGRTLYGHAARRGIGQQHTHAFRRVKAAARACWRSACAPACCQPSGAGRQPSTTGIRPSRCGKVHRACCAP